MPNLALKKAACSTFQSAPGLEAGRCTAIGQSVPANGIVSIRARP